MQSDKPCVVTHYIFECGKKLDANCLTICTAASLFHKFFKATSISDYDPYLIAGTCLYLAGKVEDNHLKLRDVINIVCSVLHRSLEPLPLGDQYWNTSVQAELFCLENVSVWGQGRFEESRAIKDMRVLAKMLEEGEQLEHLSSFINKCLSNILIQWMLGATALWPICLQGRSRWYHLRQGARGSWLALWPVASLGKGIRFFFSFLLDA